MSRYIISITAQDRSGIVGHVSEAILRLGGNIEAASQTVHQEYFAMILLCSFDRADVRDTLASDIRDAAGQDLHVFVTEHSPLAAAAGDSESFIVTAVGPDRPGILHALSQYLASQTINIDDLYCTVQQGEFVVICQTSVPMHLDVAGLQKGLEAVGRERGFTAYLQHENVFVATNELRLGRFRT